MKPLPVVLAAVLPLVVLATQQQRALGEEEQEQEQQTARLNVTSAYREGKDKALDAYITGRLVTAYALSEHLRPFRLHVDVKDSVVTLHGAVDSELLHDLAVEIGYSVDEVADVRSEMQVESGAPRAANGGRDSFAQKFTDAATTARVKSRLLWNESTHGLAIGVDTEDGVVTLSGDVDTDVESALAHQITSNTRGVRRVDNRLQVETPMNAGISPPG